MKGKPDGILLSDWKKEYLKNRQGKGRFQIMSEDCPKCPYNKQCSDEILKNWEEGCPKSKYEQERRNKKTLTGMIENVCPAGFAYFRDTSNGPKMSLDDDLFLDYVIVGLREWFQGKWLKIKTWWNQDKHKRPMREPVINIALMVLFILFIAVMSFLSGYFIGLYLK